MADKNTPGDQKGLKDEGKPVPGSHRIEHEDGVEYISRKTDASCVDYESEDSFPASDPPSFTPSHPGKPKPDPVKQKKWQ